MIADPSFADIHFTCRKCARQLPGEQKLHLWDAHDYCRQCVEKASPVLLEMAENRVRLLESLHIERSALVWSHLWALLPVTLFFCSIFMWQGMRAGAGTGELLLGLLLASLVCAFAGGVTLLGIFYIARKVEGTPVEIIDGTLESLRINSDERLSVSLSKCRWYLGKVHYVHEKLFLHQQVIIIECPKETSFGLQVRAKIACGLTNELREIWQAFLELADVPKKPPSFFARLFQRSAPSQSKNE